MSFSTQPRQSKAADCGLLMGMWLDMPGLCRQSKVNWPIECDDSDRALRYSTVRDTSDPDTQNTPTGHRGHGVWHDMGDIGRRLVKITSDWYCWNEHDTTQCSRLQGLLERCIYIYMKVFNGICTVYKGLINIERKHCVWILRKDRLKRILRDICLKNKQLNIRGLLFYYVIMALVRALLVLCVCECAFIVAHSVQQVKKINKLFSEQFKKPQIVSQLCFPEFLSTFLHSMHIFLFY